MRHRVQRYDINNLPKKQLVNPHCEDDRNILKDDVCKLAEYEKRMNLEIPKWWSPKNDLSKA